KPEPPQRLVEVEVDLRGAERRVAMRAAMRIANLGCDLRVVPERSSLRGKPFAEDDLARPAAIGVGGVEPPQADQPRMIEQLERLLLTVAGTAQFRRRADSAEVAAAENDPLGVPSAQHPGSA